MYQLLFLRIVEVTMMANCMWLGLWATNYIALANHSDNALMWHFLMYG